MERRGAALLLASMAFLGACGSAASHDYALQPNAQEPLLRLKGEITEVRDGVGELASTRAALVWFPSAPGARNGQVPQDLGPPLVTEVLKLQIDVAKAPPPEAMEMGSAQAELVFYLDDGNGKLDIRERGQPSPDRVVGRAPDSLIVWGPLRAPSAADPPKRTPSGPRVCTREPPDFLVQCDTGPGDTDTAPSRLISIRFSKEEVLNSYTCAGFAGSREWPDTTPGLSTELRRQVCTECAATSVSASGEQRPCRVEQLGGGAWKACVDEPLMCGTTFCHTGSRPLAAGESDCK